MHCQDVHVWLGPAIGPANFVVGAEVFNAFVGNNSVNESAFRSIGPEKWLADIYQLARLNLAEFGIEQIYGGGLCTVADPLRFYSYRRDGAVSGRMASMIWRD
jgi:copper oxidase (laccase) domain-containing protein